jgi:hypothetical protein
LIPQRQKEGNLRRSRKRGRKAHLCLNNSVFYLTKPLLDELGQRPLQLFSFHALASSSRCGHRRG